MGFLTRFIDFFSDFLQLDVHVAILEALELLLALEGLDDLHDVVDVEGHEEVWVVRLVELDEAVDVQLVDVPVIVVVVDSVHHFLDALSTLHIHQALEEVAEESVLHGLLEVRVEEVDDLVCDLPLVMNGEEGLKLATSKPGFLKVFLLAYGLEVVEQVVILSV